MLKIYEFKDTLHFATEQPIEAMWHELSMLTEPANVQRFVKKRLGGRDILKSPLMGATVMRGTSMAVQWDINWKQGIEHGQSPSSVDRGTRFE